ncbi:hypothetical protein HDV04_001578 [Boothiomyces sp. JEL0838]|nr:hypothetical protein HDV04_001578 [Boothiomyces sp. JEL0838]
MFFKKRLLFLLLLNLILQVINVIFGYLNGAYYFTRIASALTLLIELGIVFLDIEVLKVFAVLNEWITKKRIFYLQGFFVVWYLLWTGGQTVSIFTQPIPHALRQYCNYGPTLWVVTGVLYDNMQAVYLTLLVYKYKNDQSKIVASQAYINLLITNSSVCLFDWLAAIFLVYQLFFVTDNRIYYGILLICQSIVGLHLCGMIIVFQKLKFLAFCNKKPTTLKRASSGLGFPFSSKKTQKIKRSSE